MNTQKLKRKVQVIILAKKEILLLKLALNRGGFWQNVTGGVDSGEEFEIAAQRELWEETGIKADVKYIPLDFEFKDRFGFHVIEKVFYCELTTKINPKLSDEHTEYKWISLNEIKESDYRYPTNYYPVEWLKKNGY